MKPKIRWKIKKSDYAQCPRFHLAWPCMGWVSTFLCDIIHKCILAKFEVHLPHQIYQIEGCFNWDGNFNILCDSRCTDCKTWLDFSHYHCWNSFLGDLYCEACLWDTRKKRLFEKKWIGMGCPHTFLFNPIFYHILYIKIR